MPDPLYTYVAMAFVAGVVVGIGLCGALVNRAERTLIQARSILQHAKDRNAQALSFYQASMRASQKVGDALRRLDGGRDA